jgi:GT2 family glycosyltransferase
MAKPNVDVIVPVFNQEHLVIALVESLRRHNRIERIIIQDDKSDDMAYGFLKNLENEKVSVFQNPENKGFLATVNRSIKKNATSPYILILNSDTQAVTPNAVEAMAENLDDGAAVCGSLLVYPNESRMPGAVQHAGVTFDTNGFPIHIFAGMRPDNPAVTKWRSLNAVTGACMMVKREIWDKLGGFDTKFAPGVFEDVSFCLSVRKLGLEVVYEPRSTWFHWEHASQDGPGWFNQEHVSRNLAILFSKHGQPACDIEIFCKVR